MLWDVNRVWKQLYLIAFVDLVPVATEKVSLIRSNIVWNRWKNKIHKSEPEPVNGSARGGTPRKIG